MTGLEEVRAFAGHAEAEPGQVDAIVNNAGVMPLAPLAELRIDERNRMIDVSGRGVLHGIAATLPRMEVLGPGHIVNVSSVGSFVVQPMAAVYPAAVRCACIDPGVTGARRHDQRRDRLRANAVLPRTRSAARFGLRWSSRAMPT